MHLVKLLHLFLEERGEAAMREADVTSEISTVYLPPTSQANREEYRSLGFPTQKPLLTVNTSRADAALRGKYNRL